MSNTGQNTPGTKPGSRKAARSPKPKQAKSPQADQPEATEEPIVSAAAPEETTPIETAAEPVDTAVIEAAAMEENAAIEAVAPVAAPTDAPADTDAPQGAPPVDARGSEDTGPVGARAAPTTAPVSLQTIANAYGDYTRRSLEETRSFVEKLKGVKSLDKAVEVQTEFAHHTFEIFVAESRKIYGLHRELARQTLKPLEGLMNKPTRDQR